MKKQLQNLLLVLIMSSTGIGFGQTFTSIAADNAGNYGTAWAGDGGTGFGSWTFRDFDGNGAAGEFLQQNANVDSPNIATGNKSFGTFANSGNEARMAAFRNFDQTLKPGDRFQVDIQHGNIQTGFSMGFTLRSGTNNLNADDYNSDSRFEFLFIGGNTNYSIIGASTTDTGVGFTTSGIRVQVTLVDLNTVDVVLTTLPSGTPVTISGISLGGTANTELESLALYNRYTNLANVYFNNLSVDRETYTTTQDGDYTDINTWLNGDVPPNDGRGLIQINHNVDLNTDLEILNQLVVSSPNSLAVQSTNVLTIGSVATLDVNSGANLTFKSDVNGSAQLGEFTGTLSGTGDFTVERYMSANRAFRFVTSPVGGSQTIREAWQEGATTAISNPNPGYGTHITGEQGTAGTVNATSGFDETLTGNHSIFIWDNNTDGYASNMTSTNITLNAGDTYALFVRGDRGINLTDDDAEGSTTLRATGTMNVGTQASGTAFDALSSTQGHYSIVPNPYQAITDLCAVDRTNLNDSFWIRSVSGAVGNWLELDLSNSGGGLCAAAPVPAPGSDDSRFVPPGIAFFVQTATNGAASITFNEDDKATDNAALTTVFSQTSIFYINSRLYLTSALQNGGVERDAFGLRFDSQFTTLGDSSEDIDKFLNTNESIAVVNNGLKAIDKQNMPSLGDIIQLNITGYTDSQYSLLFMMENVPSGMGVFINDNYLGIQTEITNDYVFDFTVDANIPESIAEDRFSLVFDNTTLGVVENAFGEDLSLYPNPTRDGNFNIATTGLTGDVTIEITNVLGQVVFKQQQALIGNEVEVNSAQLDNGTYIVKLTQGSRSLTSKLIINK